MLFREFLAAGISHEGEVQVTRRGQPERLLQSDLAGGVVGQIFSAHHIGDALLGVVHHDRQLVSPEAVGAFQDKVAHFGGDDLLLRPESAVLPIKVGVLWRLEAPSHRPFAPLKGRFRPAGAGVDRDVVARWGHPLRIQRVRDLFSGARAGIGRACFLEFFQCRRVKRASLRLPDGRAIGMQATVGQLFQNPPVRADRTAGRVDVFNANQPLASVGFRIEPTGQRRHQRACMQGAGGRRGKSASVI